MNKARAVRIQGAGGPEVLSIADYSVRDPGPGEVLVEVRAAGLNRADILQRKGVYPAPPGAVADVPGLEFAGVVSALGDGVTAVKKGQHVMAITAGGGMATHVLAHERELMPIPEGMSFTDAAAIPEVFMTAYDAIVLQGGLGMGQHVLIHAVGSGVGTAALQLANAVGAIAIGTTRKADKLERCKALGLTHGIVSSDGTFAARVRELSGGKLANVILDTVGARYLNENLQSVSLGGTIITIGLLGGIKGEMMLGLLVQKRATLRGSTLRSRPLEQKAALAQAFSQAVVPLFASGKLKPVVESVLPAEQIREAHVRMEADETFGKIVLTF